MSESPVDRLLGRLDGVQRSGHGRFRAICPAHESKHRSRSLSICEAPSGAVLLHCFRGCDADEVVRAVGLELGDLFPPRVDDENRAPRVRRPWSVRDLVRALNTELGVIWIVLGDVASGRSLTDADRSRAKLAHERCAALIRELSE